MYSWLDRCASSEAKRMRTLLEAWFARYPVQERNELKSRFQSKDDFQCQSAVFELYLHELLTGLNYSLEVHPDNPSGKSKKPDFRATDSRGNTMFVEAALVTEMSDKDRAAEARKNAVYDVLNGMESPNFFIGIFPAGNPKTPPPARQIRRKIENWLKGLDPDEIGRKISTGEDTGPECRFRDGDWAIRFTAMPKSKEARDKPGIRPIGCHTIEGWAATWKAIRDIVKAKGNRYGDMQQQLLIAVNVLRMAGDIDVMQALFGEEVCTVNTLTDDPPKLDRNLNGVWTSPNGPDYTRIGGVLVCQAVSPWTFAVSNPRLWHNPWATNPVIGPICSLPQAVAKNGRMEKTPGMHPREIFDLYAEWPRD